MCMTDRMGNTAAAACRGERRRERRSAYEAWRDGYELGRTQRKPIRPSQTQLVFVPLSRSQPAVPNHLVAMAAADRTSRTTFQLGAAPRDLGGLAG